MWSLSARCVAPCVLGAYPAPGVRGNSGRSRRWHDVGVLRFGFACRIVGVRRWFDWRGRVRRFDVELEWVMFGAVRAWCLLGVERAWQCLSPATMARRR